VSLATALGLPDSVTSWPAVMLMWRSCMGQPCGGAASLGALPGRQRRWVLASGRGILLAHRPRQAAGQAGGRPTCSSR
jgi:hypothetical protein